ncbi:MAG: ABC transporter ATP-binding protein [Candidatus Heimdallarchaeota archaeon]|nr:MAG: ABC transporter ATP-binding protein [Candidatus Heimdallarchaeota archaeon]
MATTTIEKEIKQGYDYDIQKTLMNKYKSANGWFWSAFKRYPIIYLIAFILLMGNTYLSIWTLSMIGVAIDKLIIGINAGNAFSPEFTRAISLMIIFVLTSWVALSLNVYLWAIASYRVQRDMRQEFYEVIQNHSMAFFDEHDSGVILSMGMNEIDQIRIAINPSVRMLLGSMATIILTTVFLWQIDLLIGAIMAGAFVIYMIIAWFYARKVGPIRKKLATDLADLSAISQEMFRGVDVVRSFDNHDKEIEKFNTKSEEYAEDMKREGYLSAFYWPALITILAAAGVFAYGLYMAVMGQYSVGMLISALALLMSLNRQNFMIPLRLISLQAGLQNSKRLWSKMAFKDPLSEPDKYQEGEWNKVISFKNVTFAYPGTEKKVLKNVSFSIPSGARVALIGGPGSGKSTILKLLLRLYDPSKGEIEINGTSIKSMYTNYVRSNVTMVEQDIFLFSDTLRANIAFAKPDATDDEIREAAKRAQIAPFIETLPDKYETIIGERGVTLSGGQRQRVAIARAMLSNPRLLLLDDSTSAVDIKTELRLRYAMEELMKDRTSIVVTQRLTTLVASDLIILMKRGEVVDIGTHSELLQRCPDYQFMCQHLPMSESLGACRDVDVAEGGRK